MPKLLFSLVAFVSLHIANPEIKFDADKFDYGKVRIGSAVNHIFVFTNQGDQPLIITKVVPSCGCQVASFTKEPVKPGEKGEINVKFDTKNRPIGFNLKQLTVFSNARNSPHTLILRGEIQKK